MLQRSVGRNSAAQKWWQTHLTEQNFLDWSGAKKMASWRSLSALVRRRTKIIACSQAHMQGRTTWLRTEHVCFKMQLINKRGSCESTLYPCLMRLHATQRAPYPVTPCIRSTQHHRPVYYAWPAGKMTRDILLTQQNGHILAAASETGGEMSLSTLAQIFLWMLVFVWLLK